MTPLCKDCKHIRCGNYSRKICTRVAVHRDYVSGALSYPFCYNERDEDSHNTCGPEGKYFDPKPKRLRKLISSFLTSTKTSNFSQLRQTSK